MTTDGLTGRSGGVPVLRPVAARQVSAFLAIAAAVTGALSLGLGLTSVWGSNDDSYLSGVVVTRVAGGESAPEWDDDSLSWPSLEWTGPVVLAVVLLIGAAAAALLGAHRGSRDRLPRSAQLAALAGTGLLAGVAGVQAVVGRADIALAVESPTVAGQWGPAPVVLGVGALLALAAALTARRGEPRTVAVVALPAAGAPTPPAPWAGATR